MGQGTDPGGRFWLLRLRDRRRPQHARVPGRPRQHHDEDLRVAPSRHLDYVRGTKRAWTRQIAFVKDADPLGPNFFVFCDSLTPPSDAVWRLWLTTARVALDGSTGRVEGKEDVDTEIIFIRPSRVELATETISRTSASGISPTGQQGPTTTTQTAIRSSIRQGKGWTVVVFPRLKSQRPARVTALAEGKGVKVETEAGTDFVFLSPERFSFRQGDVVFEGTAGAIQVRPTGTALGLARPVELLRAAKSSSPPRRLRGYQKTISRGKTSEENDHESATRRHGMAGSRLVCGSFSRWWGGAGGHRPSNALSYARAGQAIRPFPGRRVCRHARLRRGLPQRRPRDQRHAFGRHRYRLPRSGDERPVGLRDDLQYPRAAARADEIRQSSA